MSPEEKRTWIEGVIAVVAYGVYLAIVLARAGGASIADVSYVVPMLGTIGVAIAAAIVINILAGLASPRDAGAKDERDKEIHRTGEIMGHGMVVLGAVVALVLAMAELDHFWIANAVYLAFVLASVITTLAKVVAYRRGFQDW